eukprot:366501-Chlamydomonas_euryale.AAC.3
MGAPHGCGARHASAAMLLLLPVAVHTVRPSLGLATFRHLLMVEMPVTSWAWRSGLPTLQDMKYVKVLGFRDRSITESRATLWTGMKRSMFMTWQQHDRRTCILTPQARVEGQACGVPTYMCMHSCAVTRGWHGSMHECIHLCMELPATLAPCGAARMNKHLVY